MKKLISVLLLVVLLATALSITAYADSGIGVKPGQNMPAFTVDLTDGTTATLSELLKEKDLVVLNIFASWCKPCEREFPEMEEVYQANSDRMVIVPCIPEPVTASLKALLNNDTDPLQNSTCLTDDIA